MDGTIQKIVDWADNPEITDLCKVLTLKIRKQLSRSVWTKLSDKGPDMGLMVLFYCGNSSIESNYRFQVGISIYSLKDGLQYVNPVSNEYISGATHWMNLSENIVS